MPQPVIERFYRLVSAFDSAMLVLRAADGNTRARPLHAARHSTHGELCFVAGFDETSIQQLNANPRVRLTMQAGSSRFVSIAGHASAKPDRAAVERGWRSAWNTWYPDGPQDPHLVVIRLHPATAVFWDRLSGQTLTFSWIANDVAMTAKNMATQAVGYRAAQPA